jgi:ketosteroid isomerase-like protein
MKDAETEPLRSNAEIVRSGAIFSEVARQWSAAASPLDPESLSRLYTSDAVFFGGLPDHYVGRDQVKQYFSHYVPILSAIELVLREMVVVPVAGPLLLGQGFADFRFTLPSGKTTFNSLRATLGIIEREEGWGICLHHFSPPPLAPPVPLE